MEKDDEYIPFCIGKEFYFSIFHKINLSETITFLFKNNKIRIKIIMKGKFNFEWSISKVGKKHVFIT